MKGIPMKTWEVRAILDNRKTVTRRVVKPQPIHENGFWKLGGAAWSDNLHEITPVPCHTLYNRALYHPGDILYVRETWTHTCIHCEHNPDMFFCPPDCGTCPEFVYKADDVSLEDWPDKHWRPSIHMPREAARVFLRVTDVRVERLRDITWADALKEGCERPMHFDELWDSTIKKADRALYGWEADPWVWVIEFERISREEAEHNA